MDLLIRPAPLVGFFAFFAAGAPAMAATVMVQVDDGPDVGFNDSTPVAPVGGNDRTTRGAQALRALHYAVDIWAAALDSDVPIVVSASFEPLECTAGTGVLASAAPATFVHDEPGLPANTWFPMALAERIAGVDKNRSAPDIVARFNGAAGTPDCLASTGWYFGLDARPGGRVDFVTVALHELAHGLGVTTLVDLDDGAFRDGIPDVFARHVFDETAGRAWSEMTTDAERAASIRNVLRLSWRGDGVTALAPSVLQGGVTTLTLSAPLEDLDPILATATFGPSVSTTPITAAVVRVDDGVGAVADGCEVPAPLPGAAALIEAGGCSDVDKVKNAEQAGARFALVVDDGLVPPPLPLVGNDGGQVTIPSVRITEADAARLRSSLGSTVTATLAFDTNRLRGTTRDGRVLLYATNPPAAGRAVTHWDPSVSPDLLLEPRVELFASHDLDLTRALLEDLGWTPFTCGNGIREGDEACDDGELDGDGGACRDDCSSGPLAPGDAGSSRDGGAAGAPTTDGNACALGCADGAIGTLHDAPPDSPMAGDAVPDGGSTELLRAEGESGCGCSLRESGANRGWAWAAAALSAAFCRTRRGRRATRHFP